MKNQAGRITSLDGLRGLACCVIAFLWHYLNMMPRSPQMPYWRIFYPFYFYGQYLVELFFALSGFVMAYCYKNKIMSGEIEFSTYLFKRYKHLYPLMFITLISTTGLQILYYMYNGQYYVYKCNVVDFIYNLLGIQTGWLSLNQSFNGPSWCISVEIMCYIVFFWLVKCKRENVTIRYCITVLAAMVVIIKKWGYPFLNNYMARGIAAFFVGCLIYEILNKVKEPKKIANLLIFAVIFFGVWYFFQKNVLFIEFTEEQIWFVILFVLSPAAIILAIHNRVVRKVLEVKPIVYLGEISMDIYLWHISVQIVIKMLDKMLGLHLDYGNVYVWWGYVIGVLAVATVSHFLMKKRDKIKYTRDVAVVFGSAILISFAMCMTGIAMRPSFDGNYEKGVNAFRLYNDQKMQVSVWNEKDTALQKLDVYVATWNKKFDTDACLNIRVMEKDSKEIIAEKSVRLSAIKDASTLQIQFDGEKLLKDTWYTIEFATNLQSGEDTVAICMVDDKTKIGDYELSLNGEESTKTPEITVYTRKQ